MVTSYIPRKLGSDEKLNIDKCLLKMITDDFQPFSIVENQGFKEFIHALSPNYELIHRKTLSNKPLPAEYETRLQTTKKLVREYCETICITADCWTSKNLISYIAITGHFIHTETLQYKSILIQCSAIEGSYTRTKLATELKKIAEEWNILNKINLFVTDNAANMIGDAEILGWDHFGCYAHKLNLVMLDALNLKNIATTVQKVQKTVAHFKRAHRPKKNF